MLPFLRIREQTFPRIIQMKNSPPPPYESPCVTGWEVIQERVTIAIPDSTSIDRTEEYVSTCIVFPCFTPHWHTLSFTAAESSLTAIRWDLKVFQWRNPHCTLDVIEVSHAYLDLAWAMLNVSPKCHRPDGNIIHITAVHRDSSRGWRAEHWVLVAGVWALGAYHTNWPRRRNSREKWSSQNVLKVHSQARMRNHTFWIMGQSPSQKPVPSLRVHWAMKHNRPRKGALKRTSGISPLPEDSQGRSSCAASAASSPH